MNGLTQHQTILWCEMMATVRNGYSPTIYIATAKRRAALVAVDARLEALEALAKRIAETDPYCDDGDGWMVCHFCGAYKDTPHAADCIHAAAKKLESA